MSTDSIGSGARDFANLADWFAAIPATVLEEEVGEVYNDSEFAMTAEMVFTGKTPGSFSINLRPAAGEGFKDHLTKLSYSAAQGAAFTSSTGYMRPLILNQQSKMTVQGLQFRTTAANSRPFTSFGTLTAVVKDCILDGNGMSTSGGGILGISTSKAMNCLVVHQGDGSQPGVAFEYGAVGINITAVRPSGLSAAGTGFSEGGGTTNVVKNCCAFNFTTDFTTSGWDASSDYNASDSTNAPGSNAVDSLTYADQFVSTTDDWRLKTGSGLIDAGNTDATDAPEDIVGTTRGATTDGDIGAWEFVPPPPGVNVPTLRSRARRPEDDDEDERQFNEVDIRYWWREALVFA